MSGRRLISGNPGVYITISRLTEQLHRDGA